MKVDVNKEILQRYINRILDLEQSKKSLSEDIKEIFEEARNARINVRALKEVLRFEKQKKTLPSLDIVTIDVYKMTLEQ